MFSEAWVTQQLCDGSSADSQVWIAYQAQVVETVALNTLTALHTPFFFLFQQKHSNHRIQKVYFDYITD